jgi:hypothetical protein
MKALNLDGGDVSIVTYPANPNASISIRSKILQTPERLRTMYRTLTEGAHDPALTSQLRALLENLAVEETDDDASLLADIANWPIEEIEDPEAERQIAVELELRRRRLEITRLK